MLELKKIQIENYRSVKSESIEIKEIDGKKCFMLFGLNEVGKSNLLKAISLLSEDQTPAYAIDCFRESQKTSEPICIRYRFFVNKWLTDLLEEKLSSALRDETLSNLYETRYRMESVELTEEDLIRALVDNIESMELSMMIASNGSRSEKNWLLS